MPLCPQEPTPSAATESLMTTEQLAKLLSTKPESIAAARAAGRLQLPYIKLDRLVRYRREDVDAFLAAHTVRPPVKVSA